MKSLQLQVLRSFYRGDNESTILLKVDFFDEDVYLIHDDELDSERTLMPESLTTLPIILNSPQRTNSNKRYQNITAKTNVSKAANITCTSTSQ